MALNHIIVPRDSTVFDKIQLEYQPVSHIFKTTSQRSGEKVQGLFGTAAGCKPWTLNLLISRSEGVNTTQSIQLSLNEAGIEECLSSQIAMAKNGNPNKFQ